MSSDASKCGVFMLGVGLLAGFGARTVAVPYDPKGGAERGPDSVEVRSIRLTDAQGALVLYVTGDRADATLPAGHTEDTMTVRVTNRTLSLERAGASASVTIDSTDSAEANIVATFAPGGKEGVLRLRASRVHSAIELLGKNDELAVELSRHVFPILAWSSIKLYSEPGVVATQLLPSMLCAPMVSVMAPLKPNSNSDASANQRNSRVVVNSDVEGGSIELYDSRGRPSVRLGDDQNGNGRIEQFVDALRAFVTLSAK